MFDFVYETNGITRTMAKFFEVLNSVYFGLCLFFSVTALVIETMEALIVVLKLCLIKVKLRLVVTVQNQYSRCHQSSVCLGL